MIILGWVLAILGSLMFLASSALTIRANPKRRIPIWAAPDPVPPHTVWTRVVAVMLWGPGGMLLGREQGVWLLCLLVLTLIAGISAFGAHNRRVAHLEA